MEFFLSVLGCVLFVEGLPYFTSPQGVKRMVLRLLQLPDRMLRLLGFSLMIFGLVVVYVARNLLG